MKRKLIKFKVGDIYLYKSSRMENYWMVGEITNIESEAYNVNSIYYYGYKVIKSSSGGEAIDTYSSFMDGSVYHEQCIKIKSSDDGTLLAMVL